MTAKYLSLINALDDLLGFGLMPSQREDSVEVLPLIDSLAFDGLIANSALNSNARITELNGRAQRSSSRSTPTMHRNSRPTEPFAHSATSSALLFKAQGVQAHRHAEQTAASRLCSTSPP